MRVCISKIRTTICSAKRRWRRIFPISRRWGIPTHALITLGLPKTIEVKAIDDLYRGFNSLAKKYRIDIIGGDTVASPKGIVISITLLGEVEKENLLLRSTAKPGDLICVTGKFGGPASVNYKLQNTNYKLRIEEARVLAKSRIASSMIDSSDGLVRSVIELCRASKTGAIIFENRVPKAKGATLDQALYGGEEYELVFTVPPGKLKALKPGVTVAGEMTAKKSGIKLAGRCGKIKPLRSGGFEHFI